jgi:hypothetical protein
MSASARQAEETRDTRPVAALRAGLAAAALFVVGVVGHAFALPGLRVLAVFAPFPLALARLQAGGTQAWLAAMLATGLVGSVAPLAASVTFATAFAIPGLLIGTAMARGRGMLRGCLWAGSWLTAVAGLWLSASGAQLGAIWASLLQEVGSLGEVSDALRGALPVIYPSLTVALAIAMVTVNAGLLYAYLKRHDPGWLEDGEFERLRWPFLLAVVFVVASLALLWPAARAASLNALLLTAFLFALQGLAIVAYFGARIVPPMALWLVALTFYLTHPLAPFVALALLGLFDNWFDARRWADPPIEAD